jgi:hypothetical protein
MVLFDDIAAIAAGAQVKIALEDDVKAYERDGVTRMLKLWRKYVVVPKYDTSANIVPCKFAAHLPPAVAQAEIDDPFQFPPETNWIKTYLSWRVKVAQSLLDDRMAKSTLVKEL